MKGLLAAILVALVAAAAAVGAVTPKPASLVLRPKQVGAGYDLVLIARGQSLKKPTLDICHETFASEGLRLARDQVAFQRSGSDPTIANEVVVYKPGGAAAAMRDVTSGVNRCPKGPVVVGAASITTHITPLHPQGSFLPRAIALGFHETGTVGGKPVELYAAVIYQRRGNVISGVFAYGSSLAKRLLRVTHAAEQSAANLRRG